MNYSNGKIYKICSHQGEHIYIGSTTKKYLSQRLTKHKSDYKSWKKGDRNLVSSYLLFEEYGIENCYIELLENYTCNSNDELRAKEGEYIRKLQCINKNLIHNSSKDKNKHYRETHKEEIKDRAQIYREAHKEEIKERAQIYREAHKEEIKERDRLYREIKKEHQNLRI